MALIWTGLLLALGGVLVLLDGYLLIQCLLGSLVSRRDRAAPSWSGRLAVVIPAHDEEVALQELLPALTRDLQPQDRVVVVAHNCTDHSAEVASQHGVELVPLVDPRSAGKQFALQAGVIHLEADPPDVVVFLDADCEVHRGSLRDLAAVSADRQRAVQCLDEMALPDGPRTDHRWAVLAWRVKNHLRPEGLRSLGVPCQLAGTGMAVPWGLAVELGSSWESLSLVEDASLGLRATARGMAPVFWPEVLIRSRFPEATGALRSQRTRWIHGHLHLIVWEAIPAVARGLVRGRWGMVMQALDLCIPPLSALLAAHLLLLGASLVAGGLIGAWGPLWLGCSGVGAVMAAVLVGWWRHGRGLIHPRDILRLAMEFGGRIAILLEFLVRRQKNWVRTERIVSESAVAVDHLRLLIITPGRDEAEFAHRTLESVAAQTLVPARWILVDDGSTDDTPAILADHAKRHPWMQVVTLKDRDRRIVGSGVIHAFNAGLAQVDLSHYDYVCKLDLDLDLPPRYFETLIRRMEADRRIGTCSGKAWYEDPRSGRLRPEIIGDDVSVGGAKLYRTDCFQDIGGFVPAVMWDGIDCHRCRMRGWVADSIPDPAVRFMHLRPMGSSDRGLWTGRKRHGAGQYFMGTGWGFILASATFRLVHRPVVVGSLGILWGYFLAWVKRAPRLEDPEFRRYLRRYQRSVLMFGKARAVRRIHEQCVPRQRPGSEAQVRVDSPVVPPAVP